jgi:hypothetical protein
MPWTFKARTFNGPVDFVNPTGTAAPGIASPNSLKTHLATGGIGPSGTKLVVIVRKHTFSARCPLVPASGPSDANPVTYEGPPRRTATIWGVLKSSTVSGILNIGSTNVSLTLLMGNNKSVRGTFKVDYGVVGTTDKDNETPITITGRWEGAVTES